MSPDPFPQSFPHVPQLPLPCVQIRAKSNRMLRVDRFEELIETSLSLMGYYKLHLYDKDTFRRCNNNYDLLIITKVITYVKYVLPAFVSILLINHP